MARARELNNSSEMWAHTTVDMIYGFVPESETENIYNNRINKIWMKICSNSSNNMVHTHTHIFPAQKR